MEALNEINLAIEESHRNIDKEQDVSDYYRSQQKNRRSSYGFLPDELSPRGTSQ